MTREEAWNLLTEFNKEDFHLQHAQTVEKTMEYFAERLGYGKEKEFWGWTLDELISQTLEALKTFQD